MAQAGFAIPVAIIRSRWLYEVEHHSRHFCCDCIAYLFPSSLHKEALSLGEKRFKPFSGPRWYAACVCIHIKKLRNLGTRIVVCPGCWFFRVRKSSALTLRFFVQTVTYHLNDKGCPIFLLFVFETGATPLGFLAEVIFLIL